jgi:hypothetical protein
MIIAASGHTDVIILSGDVHCGEMLHAVCKSPASAARYKAADIGGAELHLHEFTSSGLSHTFTQFVDLTVDKGGALQTISRGYHHDLVYNLYQVQIMVCTG